MYPPAKALREFLKPYDRAVRDLALALRAVVTEELVPCHETVYDGPYAVSLGYGPTGRMRDQICHVVVFARHVNLGFYYGAFLPDPDGVLEGTGSQIRHIKIQSAADMERPCIRKYLRTALEMADVADTPDRVLKGLTTVVKEGPPNKRRPTAK